MSEYLDFLSKVNGYEAAEKVGTAVMSGDVSNIFDTLKGLFDNKKITEEMFAPSVLNRHGTSTDTVADFEGNGPALVYPANLFDNGETAYILFYIKKPDGATPNNSASKFIGSNEAPKGRIALYMPPAIKVNYGAQWEEQEMKIEMGADIIRDAKAGNMAGVAQAATRAMDQVVNAGLAPEYQLLKNQILDPKNSLLFKGVNFRRFQFNFQLMARNASEAESIRKIIKSFKYAMHPGAQNSSTWAWPYFFEIYLCTPVQKYMFNIMNSALEEMDVDYGGSGVASFFRANGAPVDIRLSLQFKELFVLTKDLILKDY